MLIDQRSCIMAKRGSITKAKICFFALLTISTGVRAEEPDCSQESIRCVGAGYEYNTKAQAFVETAFQAAANDAKPGDTIFIAGGSYNHEPASPNLVFLNVSTSGTANAPIRITSFPNEKVTISGFGYPEGVGGPERDNEKLLELSGNYVVVSNLELEYSSRYGILITGSNNTVEEVKVRDSWESNIVIMGTDPNTVAGNIVRYTETYRSRHGNGIWIAIASQGKKPVIDTRIEFNLAYDNGREPNGEVVPSVQGDPAGGGNSDGIAAFKSCHDDAHLVNMTNMCARTVIRGNIVWANADDGFDFSVGEGSVVMQNISIANGPKGNKGFKMLRHVGGGIKFVGNLSLQNQNNGVEIRADKQGIFANNASMSNGLHGLNVSVTNPEAGSLKAINNLSAFNEGSKAFEFLMEGKIDANWNANESGNPELEKGAYNVATLAGAVSDAGRISEKWRNLWAAIASAYTPKESSPLVDAGVFDPLVHCAQPTSGGIAVPQPGDDLCLEWSGTGPDIGPFESGFSIVRPNPPRILD